MAGTGVIYRRVEALKDKAFEAFQHIENDDDLIVLNNLLTTIRDDAEEIRAVVCKVDDELAQL